MSFSMFVVVCVCVLSLPGAWSRNKREIGGYIYTDNFTQRTGSFIEQVCVCLGSCHVHTIKLLWKTWFLLSEHIKAHVHTHTQPHV